MGINWKVRFNNPIFWIQLVAAIILPILAYMGMSWEDMTSWPILGKLLVDAVKNPVIVVSILASIWNAVNDPTTAGITDSAEAMTYKTPKASK